MSESMLDKGEAFKTTDFRVRRQNHPRGDSKCNDFWRILNTWVFFKMKAWLRKEGLAHFIFDIKFNNTFRRKHNWILITLRQINFQDIPLGFYLWFCEYCFVGSGLQCRTRCRIRLSNHDNETRWYWWSWAMLHFKLSYQKHCQHSFKVNKGSSWWMDPSQLKTQCF